MTAAEILRQLGISRRTLNNYISAGCPHSRKGGGKRAPLVFDLGEVKAWMVRTARTGEAGRPPSGCEPSARSGEAAPGDDDASDLVDLIRRVNLEIKNLEVRKRERLEREANGELVEVAEIARLWRSQIEVVQTSFRSLPGILAQRLAHSDYDTIYEALEEELHSVLVAFSETPLTELAA